MFNPKPLPQKSGTLFRDLPHYKLRMSDFLLMKEEFCDRDKSC